VLPGVILQGKYPIMAKAAKKKVTEDSIISAYMSYVLEHEVLPTNVFKFSKEINVGEDEFYKFFGSLETIQGRIWQKFFENTVDTIEKDKSFGDFSNRERLLSMLYTLFENLTLNRSYILFTMGELNVFGKRRVLAKMKHAYVSYLKPWFEKDYEKNDPRKIAQKVVQPSTLEALWGQFVFLLDFWIKDDSSGFEKTDVAIEKSVRAGFDLMDTAPLESIFDFGKFVWKERMSKA